MPLMGWNQSINNYITETRSMKFTENELIYIVQSTTKWRFLKFLVQRNFAFFSSLSVTSKANKIQMYSRSKIMSVALYLCHWNTIPSSTFQCWTMEYHSKFNTMMFESLFCFEDSMSNTYFGKDYLIFLWNIYLWK
jgi:hypothetical protein